MKVPEQMLPEVVGQLVAGAARLQARQEMLECVVRAIIAESPPAYPLFWQALQTAKSDLEARWSRARPNAGPMPELDAAAMGLWNELCSACAPPAGPGNEPQPPKTS